MDMINKLFFGNTRNQTGKTFAWTVASGIVYALSSLVFLAIVTNFLGKSEAGVYSIGMVIAQQMLTVGKYSVRNYQVSDVKVKYSFEDYFTFRMVTSFVMLMITVGWIFFGGYRGEEAIVILCMTIYKMAECVSDIFEGLYQQKFRLDISGKSQFIKNFITIFVFVIMVAITRNLVVSSIGLAVSSILIIIIIDVPLTRNFAKLRWNFDYLNIKGLTIACFSLFLSSFLYVYINNAPKYAVLNYEGKEGLVSFNALFMPVFAVDLLAGFTLRMWLTKMAVFHEEKEHKKFVHTIYKQAAVIGLITLSSMIAMYYLGGFFLTLIYGIDLHGYEMVNALLMLGGGLVAYYNLLENVIVVYRQQHYSIVINIIAAIFAAVVIPIMASKYQILGATLGYIMANGVRTLGYLIIAIFYMLKEKNSLKRCVKNI